MWSGIVSDTQERTVFLAVSCFLKFLRKQYDVRLYPGVHSSSPSSTIVHMKSPAEEPPTADHRKRQKFPNDDFPVSDVQRIHFVSLKRLDFVVNEVNLIDRNEILLWLLVFTIITYCRLEFYHSQNWCKWFIIFIVEFIVEDYFEAAWVVLWPFVLCLNVVVSQRPSRSHMYPRTGVWAVATMDDTPEIDCSNIWHTQLREHDLSFSEHQTF